MNPIDSSDPLTSAILNDLSDMPDDAGAPPSDGGIRDDAGFHPHYSQPLQLDLRRYYAEEALAVLESRLLADAGIYPALHSIHALSAHPCGFPVSNPLPPPLMGVAKIKVTKHDHHTFNATAFLILPSVLLTAAHNLLPWLDPHPGNRVLVPKIDVTLPTPAGGHFTCAATGYVVSPEWQVGYNQGRDYGLIFIPSASAANTPIPPKRVLDIKALYLAVGKTTLAGYPDSQSKPYTGNGPFSPSSSNNLVLYQIDSCTGESGAPAYIQLGGRFCAMAVNVSGQISAAPHMSAGVVVDEVMCAQLDNWLGFPVWIP